MSRYKVVQDGTQTRWLILDRHLWGYCALPEVDENGKPVTSEDGKPILHELSWRAEAAAEAWLQHCYRAWQRGTVPAPRQWQPLPPLVSAWVHPDTEPVRHFPQLADWTPGMMPNSRFDA
jgi:hypothetical protein